MCSLSALIGGAVALVVSQGSIDAITVAGDPAPVHAPATAPAVAPAPALAPVPAPQPAPPLPAEAPHFGAPYRIPPVPVVANQPVVAREAAESEEFTREEQINIAVYERSNRSVVNITTRSAAVNTFFAVEQPTEGSGSGSVLDAAGHILTNYHVVDGARQIRVTLYDGETYDATLIGQDPQNDIAVLRIQAPPASLSPLQLGDSSRLKVGQKIYAIGNPFGLERTMTVGIISSLNRSLPSGNNRTIKSIIQIDAALNRGNSGGPLLDSRGRLVGMNTAIASRTGESSGVGFAIPVSTIARVVPQLIQKGRVTRPELGISQVYQTDNGLVIATLRPGGPAEKAGLRGFRILRTQKKRGLFLYEERQVDRNYADMIVAADGKEVRTADELLTIVESKSPGDRIQLTVVREKKRTSITVRLGGED